MSLANCPGWEYDSLPRKTEILAAAISYILIGLRKGTIDSLACACDTRPSHRRLFYELAPDDHKYYAGNYRGDEYLCLKIYSVMIQGEPLVGYPPEKVLSSMAWLEADVRKVLATLDEAQKLPDAHISREDKLIYIVAAACEIFVRFLGIHPYANGNGHAARLIIWAILLRYGHVPKRWPIDPRPPDPMYSNSIYAYRRGNKEPLERFVLQCILGV